MKIILLSDSLGAGGAQRQLCGLAVMLRNEGHEVELAYYHDDEFYKEYLDSNNIPNRLLKNASGILKRIYSVFKYLKRQSPDWVIAYQETPSILATICRVLGLKYKLLVSERNTTQYLGIKEKIRFNLYKWADSIVPNSYTQATFLITKYPWMKTKLTTITNFVDLAHFQYYEKKRCNIPIIVVAASIWPPKNTLGLIESVNILKKRSLKFKVQWYGYSSANQTYYDQAINLINKYELNEYVELLPKTSQIHKVYMQCDYFCLPSFYEGVPNVIAEAMASGRPVICSDVCDNSRYVTEGENGFLFDPNNSENMANAIEQALNVSDEKYEILCKRSRQLAEQLLSTESFVDKYIKILDSK